MKNQNPFADDILYPYLHQFLLENMRYTVATTDSQEIFAEVYAICRKAATDPTPGDNLATRYIGELKSRTDSTRLAELIICLSWVVLVVQEKPSYAISTFASQIQPLIQHCSVFLKSKQLAIDIRKHERHLNTEFLKKADVRNRKPIEEAGTIGVGNTYNNIKIEKLENFNPSATTVINKYYNIHTSVCPDDEAAIDAIVEQSEEKK